MNKSNMYNETKLKDVDSSESNKFSTKRVVFKEKLNIRACIEELLLIPFSLKLFNKPHLRAIYATRKGYKTCDYSQNKGFYNF